MKKKNETKLKHNSFEIHKYVKLKKKKLLRTIKEELDAFIKFSKLNKSKMDFFKPNMVLRNVGRIENDKTGFVEVIVSINTRFESLLFEYFTKPELTDFTCKSEDGAYKYWLCKKTTVINESKHIIPPGCVRLENIQQYCWAFLITDT
jgi:hypothetical protein